MALPRPEMQLIDDGLRHDRTALLSLLLQHPRVGVAIEEVLHI